MRHLARLLLTAAILVAVNSASAFGQSDPTIEYEIGRLGSESFEEREAAETALRTRGAAALDALLLRTADPDPEIRVRVERLVATIREELALGELLSDDPDRRFRSYLALGAKKWEFLRAHASERLAPALTDVVLFETEGLERREAILVLESIGTPAIWPALLWGVRDRDDHYQHGQPGSNEAVRVVSGLSDAGVLGELDRLASQGFAGASRAAAAIRTRLPALAPTPPAFTPFRHEDFLVTLEAAEPEGRVRAIRALISGGTGSPEELSVVSLRLADLDARVRLEAARAFTHRVHEGTLAALADRAADLREETAVRQMAVLALGFARHERAFPAILPLLDDASPEVRRTAATALAGSESSLDGLSTRLAVETDPAVRKAIEDAIETVRGRIDGEK